MRAELRIPRTLHTEVLRDLRRGHPFAYERVGFLFGRLSQMEGGNALILVNRYHSIPDEQYVRDSTVGARIGEEAIAYGMEQAHYGAAVHEGLFHVHLHDGRGPTGMSSTDQRELPALIPGFRSMGKTAAHGIVILSADHGTAWIWIPGRKESVVADRIAVVGAPLSIFEGRSVW